MLSKSYIGAAVVLLAAELSPGGARASGQEVPAAETSGYDVYADVVQVSPRYVWRDVAEPVRECTPVAPSADRSWRAAPRREPFRERYRRRGGADAGGAGLLGGLIGGLIGHQLGHGDGRAAFTVAGALLGSAIASERVRRQHAYDDPGRVREIRRCTELTRNRRVREAEGYDVVYRYHGATFHKWVAEPPGEAVLVHVSVAPADAVQ